MKLSKKEIVKTLTTLSQKIKHSPGRREINHNLYKECVNKFGSFNLAKKAAKLKIYRRKCNPLPKKAYILDKELASLVSFITFDGHLRKDLKEFEIISKDKKILLEFKKLIRDKFHIEGRFEKGIGYGEAIKYRVANVNICKYLYSLGVPKGDKVINKFDIPRWIKNSKNLAREYLKIAFYCEGCKFRKSRYKEAIQINLNKSEDILSDGLKFLKSIKILLKKFDIETTNTWICKGNLRNKDLKTSKLIKFRIKTIDTNRFINRIGWLK